MSRDNAAGPGRAPRYCACRPFVGSEAGPNLGREAIRCPKDGRDTGHVHDPIDRVERDPWAMPALDLPQRVHAYTDATGELLLREAEALAGTGDQLGEGVWGHGVLDGGVRSIRRWSGASNLYMCYTNGMCVITIACMRSPPASENIPPVASAVRCVCSATLTL